MLLALEKQCLFLFGDFVFMGRNIDLPLKLEENMKRMKGPYGETQVGVALAWCSMGW